MKLKTRKAALKRLKITKNNKFLRRRAGQDHFRAKKSGQSIREKHGGNEIAAADRPMLEKLLPY